jgi:hypothetical protein
VHLALHAALPLCPGSVPVVGTACSAVSGVAGKVVGVGADAVFSAAGQWVASGAVWLLGQVGTAMSASTSVNLGAGWFAAHEAVMATLAAAVVLPMACCAAIQAVYRQSPSMLVRSFLVYLPLSLVLTGVAVELVRFAMALTDSLSSRVLASAGVDTTNLLAPLSTFLIATGSPVPAFVLFVGALVVAVMTMVLWLELVVRAAAISAAVLFLPLSLASLVWPAVSHWCRRLADTLVALVLSKFVIAAVLSLGVAALAGGFGLSGSASGGGFAAVVTGIALLLVATMSPFTLLRLVPAMEAGAVSHLESTRHRLQAAAQAPIRARNLAMDYVAAYRGGGTRAGGTEGSVGTASPGIGMLTGVAAGGAFGAAAGGASGGAGRGATEFARGGASSSQAGGDRGPVVAGSQGPAASRAPSPPPSSAEPGPSPPSPSTPDSSGGSLRSGGFEKRMESGDGRE